VRHPGIGFWKKAGGRGKLRAHKIEGGDENGPPLKGKNFCKSKDKAFPKKNSGAAKLKGRKKGNASLKPGKSQHVAS